MKTIFTKQKLFFIFAALVAFVFFFGLTTGANTYAADNAVSSFDDTDVVEDLKAAGLTLENYPKKSDGKVQVIYFVEYGYNIRANEQANYGLYLYVYNPAEVNINVDGKNFVQLSSKRDASGKPTDYSKYSVKCVSKSSGVYGKLFYKFKVVAGLSEQLAYVDDDVRRYDVSGIELQTAGEANATEYPISTSFYYSGYAKGFGKDKTADSTLSCRSEELETIGLEVKHTTYKYQNAKNGGQEIASVYFNVLNESFKTAYALRLIDFNPMLAVRIPSHKQNKGSELTPTQLDTFLHNIAGHEIEKYFYFLLLTGCRRSEALTVRWSDIDFEKKTLHVPGTKTETSDRVIPLFADVEKLVLSISRTDERLFNFRPDYVTHVFKEFCPEHKLHDLRHTFATVCMENGVPIKVVQNWLGHSKIDTTANIYSHVTKKINEEEAAKLNGVFGLTHF